MKDDYRRLPASHSKSTPDRLERIGAWLIASGLALLVLEFLGYAVWLIFWP